MHERERANKARTWGGTTGSDPGMLLPCSISSLRLIFKEVNGSRFCRDLTPCVTTCNHEPTTVMNTARLMVTAAATVDHLQSGCARRSGDICCPFLPLLSRSRFDFAKNMIPASQRVGAAWILYNPPTERILGFTISAQIPMTRILKDNLSPCSLEQIKEI